MTTPSPPPPSTTQKGGHSPWDARMCHWSHVEEWELPQPRTQLSSFLLCRCIKRHLEPLPLLINVRRRWRFLRTLSLTLTPAPSEPKLCIFHASPAARMILVSPVACFSTAEHGRLSLHFPSTATSHCPLSPAPWFWFWCILPKATSSSQGLELVCLQTLTHSLRPNASVTSSEKPPWHFVEEAEAPLMFCAPGCWSPCHIIAVKWHLSICQFQKDRDDGPSIFK